MIGQTSRKLSQPLLARLDLVVRQISDLAEDELRFLTLVVETVAAHLPPGWASIETEDRGVLNPAGPHHSASSSGSVQALNTRSRGASMTRMTPNSVVGTGDSSAIAVLSVAVGSTVPATGGPRPRSRPRSLNR
jgi:hypothetical protein